MDRGERKLLERVPILMALGGRAPCQVGLQVADVGDGGNGLPQRHTGRYEDKRAQIEKGLSDSSRYCALRNSPLTPLLVIKAAFRLQHNVWRGIENVLFLLCYILFCSLCLVAEMWLVRCG